MNDNPNNIKKERVSFTIYIDVTPTSKTMNTKENAQRVVQHVLNNSLWFHNPTVSLLSPEELNM